MTRSTPTRSTPTRRTGPARAWLLRRLDDVIVLAAAFGLALPFLVPLS